MNGLELVDAYVTLHNLGVKAGAFASLLGLFHPEAELRFEGLDYGPFIGRDAIAKAFADNPPDDELEIGDLAGDDLWATATYVWRTQPAVVAGTLRLEAEAEGIRRLTIHPIIAASERSSQ